MQDSNNGGLRVCLLITAMLVVAMATGDDAQAQPGSLKLGVQAVGVLPTSDLDDSAAKGGGINIYLAYLLSDVFCVEGHTGYHKFGSEDLSAGGDISAAFIPVRSVS